jgi:Ca2+-binding EF-hand superfamily protein
MSRIILLALAVSFGSATPALAQNASQFTPFEKTDQNGDGKVSFEEYRNRAAFLFHDYDSNQDQHLTANELPEYRNAKGVVVETQSITIDDYMASISHSFDMGDLDKDGFLQTNEWGVAPSMNK